MNLSLDEYRALVAKAFRGVGYPWGLTEDASWAARRLAEFDATSPQVVLSLLKSLDTTSGVRPADQTVEKPDLVRSRMPANDWTCEADALCPICVGTVMLDLGTASLARPITLGPTLAPELCTPFLAEILGSDPQSMGSDPTILVEWGGGSCAITPDQLINQGIRVQRASSVLIRSNIGSDLTGFGPMVLGGSDPIGSKPNRTSRVTLESLQIQALEGYARRVYAPATDGSRAGAGAGNSDND